MRIIDDSIDLREYIKNKIDLLETLEHDFYGGRYTAILGIVPSHKGRRNQIYLPAFWRKRIPILELIYPDTVHILTSSMDWKEKILNVVKEYENLTNREMFVYMRYGIE